MAFGSCFRLASDGAGYDDYNQANNDAYRDSDGVEGIGTKPPT